MFLIYGDRAITSPTYNPYFCVGIHTVNSTYSSHDNPKHLIAMLTTSIPKFHIYDMDCKMAAINFLCVHKKYRKIGLTPLMLQELLRRLALKTTNLSYGIFTAASKFTKPLATCKFFHRKLNVQKLIEINFTTVPNGVQKEDFISDFELPIVMSWAFFCH